MTEFPLDSFLRSERERIEDALARSVDGLVPELHEALREPVRHGVLAGGKRLRPILCVEAFRAVGGDPPEAAYDLGVSLELIHAYSLMHDDLPCMDDAPLRRGRPTVHRLHGELRTTLAGAALIPAAGRQAWRAATALGCDDGCAAGIVRELMVAAGAGGMVGGQVLDLVGEGEELDAASLDELHRLKTGALLRACLTIGGMAADASPGEGRALDEYGRAIGLAFQIADDVLDETSSAEELGKAPSDADLGKSTYVALHGLDGARARAVAEVERALDALDRGGIRSEALRALARYVVERES